MCKSRPLGPSSADPQIHPCTFLASTLLNSLCSRKGSSGSCNANHNSSKSALLIAAFLSVSPAERYEVEPCSCTRSWIVEVEFLGVHPVGSESPARGMQVVSRDSGIERWALRCPI